MWDVELAKLFKDRDNKNLIGPCVGKIAGVNPLKVSILNGQITLQATQLYITSGLQNKSYTIDINGENVSGSVSPSGNLTSLNVTNGSATLKYGLKVNDEVLLIPADNGQVFFIVDKIQKVGG